MPSTIDVIEVEDGQVYEIQESQGNIIIGALKLGVGSTLRIDPRKTPIFTAHIHSLTAGENSVIDATGVAGRDKTGKSPDRLPDQGKCSSKHEVATPGVSGPRGEHGGHGASIYVRVGIDKVESLLVNTSGADGGASGDGGRGAKGKRASCNNRCNGVRGGAGGNALQSNGGNGGSITWEYWLLDTPGEGDPSPIPGIRFVSEGGRRGRAGRVGAGGAGGDRHSCSWPQNNRPGGQPGPLGSFFAGVDGRSGTISFVEIETNDIGDINSLLDEGLMDKIHLVYKFDE